MEVKAPSADIYQNLASPSSWFEVQAERITADTHNGKIVHNSVEHDAGVTLPNGIDKGARLRNGFQLPPIKMQYLRLFANEIEIWLV